MKHPNDVSHWFFKNWAEENIKINHPTKGLIPWKQFSYHDTLAETLDTNDHVIVNKFRQSGISTFCVAHALWETLFNDNKKILFITRTDRCAVELSYIMRKMIENLPEPIIPVKNNYHEISFQNKSVIRFSSAEYMKSTHVDHLYVDEAAFIRNMDQYWEALYPSIANGGKVTIVSTPNGNYGWFFQVFDWAVNGKNEFKALSLNWRDHPDYNNPSWEEKMINNLGEKGFLQEIAGLFLPPQKSKNNSDTTLNTADIILNKIEELKTIVTETNKMLKVTNYD